MGDGRDPVVVTTAGLSHTDDRKLRQRRYAITQGIRVSCFVLAVALPVPLWAKLVLIVGAFTLPWFGVMAANAGPAVPHLRPKNGMVPPPDQSQLPLRLEPGRTIDQEP